jgi:hypothetical protein
MTLQVGLVGTDGIVLASDKQIVSIDNETGVAHTCMGTKVLFSEGVLVAAAGAGTSLVAAKRILTDLPTHAHLMTSLALEDIGMAVMQKASIKKRFEVMAILRTDLSRILHLHVDSEFSQCEPKEDKCIAGHAANASLFFTERYYKCKPIRELALLAAYVVLQGAQLKTGGIDGLEVIFCQSDGFHRLSEASLESITDPTPKNWTI